MVFVYILLFVHVWSKAHFECDILNACISIYLLEVKVVCGSCRRIVAEGLWMRGWRVEAGLCWSCKLSSIITNRLKDYIGLDMLLAIEHSLVLRVSACLIISVMTVYMHHRVNTRRLFMNKSCMTHLIDLCTSCSLLYFSKS